MCTCRTQILIHSQRLVLTIQSRAALASETSRFYVDTDQKHLVSTSPHALNETTRDPTATFTELYTFQMVQYTVLGHLILL